MFFRAFTISVNLFPTRSNEPITRVIDFSREFVSLPLYGVYRDIYSRIYVEIHYGWRYFIGEFDLR